jgi:hypothetical protein
MDIDSYVSANILPRCALATRAMSVKLIKQAIRGAFYKWLVLIITALTILIATSVAPSLELKLEDKLRKLDSSPPTYTAIGIDIIVYIYILKYLR